MAIESQQPQAVEAPKTTTATGGRTVHALHSEKVLSVAKALKPGATSMTALAATAAAVAAVKKSTSAATTSRGELRTEVLALVQREAAKYEQCSTSLLAPWAGAPRVVDPLRRPVKATAGAAGLAAEQQGGETQGRATGFRFFCAPAGGEEAKRPAPKRFLNTTVQSAELLKAMEAYTSRAMPASAFLASYGVAGDLTLPEWVAWSVSTPMTNKTYRASERRSECRRRGVAFTEVNDADFRTPHAAFLDDFNREIQAAGLELDFDGMQLGQLSPPTHHRTCESKQPTYLMTNVVPVNRYMWRQNWARADRAVREFVERRGDELLRSSVSSANNGAPDVYAPVYAVAGVAFRAQSPERIDWMPKDVSGGDISALRRTAIPDTLWQAVYDPWTNSVAAWSCLNRPKGPWPEISDPDRYRNGPKLCTSMSLATLRDTLGVEPFPSLPAEVVQSLPSTAWRLPMQF